MTTFPAAPGFRSSKREHRIVIIDGPNKSNLGARNKRVYGAIAPLEDLQNFCKNLGASLGVNVTTFSSNFEGAILEQIHESANSTDAYILSILLVSPKLAWLPSMHSPRRAGRTSKFTSRTS